MGVPSVRTVVSTAAESRIRVGHAPSAIGHSSRGHLPAVSTRKRVAWLVSPPFPIEDQWALSRLIPPEIFVTCTDCVVSLAH
jgi:hypothetical protein